MHVEPKRDGLAALDAGSGERPASRVRYAVLGAFCLAAFIAYVQRNSIGVAESTIRGELGLTKPQMGWVMSAFMMTYAALQIPGGALAKRWGTRRALSSFAFTWSVAAAIVSLAGGMASLIGARLVQGAAQAGIFPCTTVGIGNWMPATSRAVASGILASFMSLGGATGGWLTGWMLADVGWRVTFAIFAVPGIVWSVWFYFWYRDEPWQHSNVNEEELRLIRPDGVGWQRKPKLGVSVTGAAPTLPEPATAAGITNYEPTPWADVLRSWPMLWICAQQFFRAAGYTFFVTWYATYLQETKGVSVEDSGWQSSLPVVAVVLAGFVGGGASDFLLRRSGNRRVARQAFSVLSLLASAGLILLAYFVADPLTAVLVVSGGSFAASLAGPCAYAITIDMGGAHKAPIFSTMNMCGNIGAAACPLVVPWFVALTGSEESILILFAGISLAAALCWMPFDANGTIVREGEPAGGSRVP